MSSSGGGGGSRSSGPRNKKKSKQHKYNTRYYEDGDDEEVTSTSPPTSNNNSSGRGTTTTSTGVTPSSEASKRGGREFSNTEEYNDEEEEEEEQASVVNASLLVNLSNANISCSEKIEQLRNDNDDQNQEDQEEDNDNTLDEDDNKEVEVEASSSEEDVTVEELQNVSKQQSPDSGEKSNTSPDLISSTRSNNTDQLDLGPPQQKSSASSSSESTTLADSEVATLMSSGNINTINRNDLGQGQGQLPSTVTELTAPNGVKVYLVGTAHFSQQSQVDVVQTIQMTHPTIVLLELCSSRRNILSLDEETVLREVSEMSFQKVRLALSNSGTVQGTLHLLLLSMSAQLTKKLGMAPGGEFRAAMREARKIPGCVLLLGDRPFNITISRALAALSFFQKMKLGWQFLTCNDDITKDNDNWVFSREEIEKCKEKDLLERMLTEMTGEFPTITEVFVNERDVYLAHSLYLAATSDAHRSNGGPVVGVVGMGHVAGIVKNWGKTTDEGVGAIIRIPETPLSTIIIRKTFKVVLYSATLYGMYRVGSKIFRGRNIVGSIVNNLKVNEIFKKF